MELDDQLAALAAGELDAADARALEARVAVDPALAARLARFEQLHVLLTTWATPELTDDGVARLDASVDAALAALDDGPLTAASPSRGAGLRALPDVERAEPPAGPVPAVTDDEVVELSAARAARTVPTWVAGLGAAAAVLGVVGLGAVVVGTGGSSDETSSETLADDSADAPVEESAESLLEEDATSDEQDGAFDAQADAGPAATAEMAPRRATGVEIPEGQLLTLLTGDTAAGSDAPTAGGDEALATCVDEALTRDTDQDTERFIELLAAGSYGGADAVFVVLRAPGPDGDTVTVLAYDPAACTLLDSATAAG